MPYIKQEDRAPFYGPLVSLPTPKNAGELNFVLTRIIHAYYRDNGGRYQQINDVLGALDGAGKEFYRRIAAPYEDAKIAENGDALL